MIRIKTKLAGFVVHTLFSIDTWYTIVSDVSPTHFAQKQKSQSLGATNLYDAGANHLSACVKVRDAQ